MLRDIGAFGATESISKLTAVMIANICIGSKSYAFLRQAGSFRDGRKRDEFSLEKRPQWDAVRSPYICVGSHEEKCQTEEEEWLDQNSPGEGGFLEGPGRPLCVFRGQPKKAFDQGCWALRACPTLSYSWRDLSDH